MCGINGILTFHQVEQTSGRIERMNQAVISRGPDAVGYYKDNRIELGHRRLSIIDLSNSANQPMSSHDGNIVIVYNGEIYNYQTIKNELNSYPFKTNSDTEVILAAFQTWGVNAVEKLNGIFSFAIWDKIKKELTLARDHLGVKPLYYCRTDNYFIFSSSLKAILNSGFSLRNISKVGLDDYLRYQTVHAPNTIIDDIKVLMPGNFAIVKESSDIKIKSYWKINKIEENKFRNENDARNAVRSQIEKTVTNQMVADVPFGAFLSGGLDSSLMVALMSKNSSSAINTFSLTFKEEKFSEKNYALKIAKKFNSNHHNIELTANSFKDLIPDALKSLDHPSSDGLNTYVVSKKTSEQGIKMAISGLGADELFGGYPIFQMMPKLRNQKFISLLPKFIRIAIGELYKILKPSVASDKISLLLNMDRFDFADIYQVYRMLFSDTTIKKLLNTNELTTNAVYNIVSNNKPFAVSPRTNEWTEISLAEITTYLQNILLRDTDQMSMSNSLEVRVPFLDHELVELVLSIPDKFKKSNVPKGLLINCFKDLLPDEILNRSKMGFTLPYEIWLKQELREFCELQLQFLKQLNIINQNEVDKLWNQFQNDQKQVTWTRIWTLVVLSYWLQENNLNSIK